MFSKIKTNNMRTILPLFICFYCMISCMNTNPEESKICKCNVQEYERIIVFKNENDGTYTGYSDTGWAAKGDLKQDSAVDCFKNQMVKNEEFSSNYDSQYRREIHRKWIYICK